MLQGKSIVELAQQLQDIKSNSRDFVVPTERMQVKLQEVNLEQIIEETEKRQPPAEPVRRPVVEFQNGETERFDLNPWSDRQLAQYADIPQAYYDRIKGQNPVLFADNVNHGLAVQVRAAQDAGRVEARMLRTYRGGLRALLSSRYRILDCYDLLATVAPVLMENGFEPVSTQITDKRMYLQLVTPRITADVKVGDTVQYGLTISGSDVGAGSVRVEPLIYRLRCTNGMVMATAMRKFHIGKNQAEDDVFELLTDETKQISDQAFWAQVRDVVIGSMKQEYFMGQVDRLRVAANEPIKNFDLPRVVELATRAVGITGETVKNDIVAYLANGADGAGLTRWGLANAITAAANKDGMDYDQAVDYERAGAKLIDLPAKQWETIAAAPAA